LVGKIGVEKWLTLNRANYIFVEQLLHRRSRVNSSLYVPTVEFVFAPEERDVYSYERTPKDLAPLGAKPSSGTFTGAGKKRLRCLYLRSSGVKKGPPDY
jgi:hypothetical protein